MTNMIDLPGYPITPEQMEQVEEHQASMCERMRSVPKEGQMIKFRGKEYFVLPGVFWPQVDGDSGIGSCTPILDYYRIESAEVVLDFGTGSGVLAIDAALRGAAPVYAVDSNPDAVKSAQMNAERQGVSCWIQSLELLSYFRTKVWTDNKNRCLLDVMLGNLPFRNKPANDEVEAAMWDTDFAAHREFFSFADRYLHHNGRIYLAQANFGGVEEALALAEQHGFKHQLIGTTPMPGDDPRVFYCFEMTRR